MGPFELISLLVLRRSTRARLGTFALLSCGLDGFPGLRTAAPLGLRFSLHHVPLSEELILTSLSGQVNHWQILFFRSSENVFISPSVRSCHWVQSCQVGVCVFF